ncbi:syndecan-1 [Rhinoderma darwinii]|uniref:syndecan-1 n=1 Tax=Rhinoderma darwinii TaxID=43563 RepID=UPI003F666C94
MNTLPVLCLLGILGSVALASDKAAPPVDLDGSGDDEDFSGSGFDGLKDVEETVTSLDSKSTWATVAPTMEGSTAAQEPEIAIKEETKVEDITKSTETTKTHDIIEDLFAVDTVAKEVATEEATTSTFQQTSEAHLEEMDIKKHHHHPHHHPHHHTTASTTFLPSESAGHADGTTDITPEAAKPHDLPDQTTTSTPDKESDLIHIPQELTTLAEDLAKHGVLHEGTTSGSATTYADIEVAVEPLDADNLPALDRFETTTVAEDSPTHTDHHLTTASSFGGVDVQQEGTTRPSDLMEYDEGDVQEGEHITTVAEEGHRPHHGHHGHHTTHRTTMEPEKPNEVHTQEPKGRRVHVPGFISTTAVPVINEDEYIPEDAENDDFTSSTPHYNVSRNPFDENDISDSKEEGPSGDMFFEASVPVLNKGRMDPSADAGSSDASHGIMERKELLAGIIAGGVAGLVFAAFLVAFVLYRMKKKDEGSYSLEEPKQSNGGYQKPREQREFYA